MKEVELILRVVAGGLSYLIAIILIVLLVRIWHLMVKMKANGLISILFHTILPSTVYVLGIATLLVAGIWLRDELVYRLSISVWILLTTLWLLIAIVFALMCITREIYDTRRKNPAGHNETNTTELS